MMPTTPAASQKQAFPLAGFLNRLSLSESHTKHRNSPSLPAHRNLLIKLNCPELEQSANSLILSRNAQSVCREIKDEQCSGSVKPENYSGSAVIQHGCIYENQQVKSKEKGGTENTALWGYGFYHHELNQYLAARQDLQLVRNYSQNPHMLNDSSNLRNDNANLRNYKNQHIAEQYARTYEILVGHRVTVSKPVQPFGSIPSRSSRWRQESLTHELKLPCPATESICSSSESSKRMFFTVLLERSNSRFVFFSCIGIYQWCSVFVDGIYHLLLNQELKITKPSSALTLAGPLTTNDRLRIEVAMLNHTQTRPKFQYLFLAVHRSDLNAKPHRESVTAHSEQDARRSLAGQFVLSFAGRIPAQGVCNA
ncbi:phage immunity repressor protein [Yersinia enterocolitica]|nr:phage immunity repressor protein [Yersinia enterocolitica]CQH71323.1 phage immunity repressor protein [Yersinia enterocolitica]